jgi:hypothetical protein
MALEVGGSHERAILAVSRLLPSRQTRRAICPFCGAMARVDVGPTRTIAGRLSRAALFAAGAVGAAVATTDCSAQPPYGAGPHSGAVEVFPNGTEDSSASDSRSVEAADAADASATTGPTDSASAADVPFGGRRLRSRRDH